MKLLEDLMWLFLTTFIFAISLSLVVIMSVDIVKLVSGIIISL